MLEEAREKGNSFYQNYLEASKNNKIIKNTFEHEIPNTEDYRMLREYLEILQ